MHIVHVALGGCLTYPDVAYGITEDTGGHIAYVLGAALAQARRTDVARVDIVTRAFYDPSLGRDHSRQIQRIGPKVRILRLATDDTRYLAKEALAADRQALGRAFAALIVGMPHRPDILHVHFADAAALVRSTAARHGIPVIYTPHSLGMDKATCMGRKPSAVLTARIGEERAALSDAAAIIVSSRDEAERQIEEYGIDVAAQIRRIPPGVILPPCAPGTPEARALIDPLLDEPERPLILAIARPVAKKNLAALVRAYTGHPTLRDRANLVILAGQRAPGIEQTGEMRTVIAELEALATPHAGRIALPCRHTPSVVPQMYRLARHRRGVFVNPALHEPFGLTLLEAASAGLPVVATNRGGPVDILETLRCGKLIDPTDIGAIGRAIADLLDGEAVWTKLSDAARKNIAAFDWDVWAARAQRVYTDLHRRAPVFAAPPRLLACDIDGTLTGSERAAAAFRDWAASRTVPFIVATGRCISEARAVIAQWGLPDPEAWITAVGTELYRAGPCGRLALCPDFREQVSRDWDREATLDALRMAGARFQSAVEQRRWKLACFGDREEAGRLSGYLLNAGLKCRVVPSHGRLIDVLAPHGGKAAAIAAFARSLSLTMRDCIAAGDSGNDRDMLLACGLGIIVGNALPDLNDLPGRAGLYRARAHHADGVLEGLDRAGLLHATPRRTVRA